MSLFSIPESLLDHATVRLRGGRQRGDRAPLQPPVGALPLNPNLMHTCAICCAYMPLSIIQTCVKDKATFLAPGMLLRVYIWYNLFCRRGFRGTGVGSPNRGSGGEAPQKLRLPVAPQSIIRTGAKHPTRTPPGTVPPSPAHSPRAGSSTSSGRPCRPAWPLARSSLR
jgi:hypothetical protein